MTRGSPSGPIRLVGLRGGLGSAIVHERSLSDTWPLLLPVGNLLQGDFRPKVLTSVTWHLDPAQESLSNPLGAWLRLFMPLSGRWPRALLSFPPAVPWPRLGFGYYPMLIVFKAEVACLKHFSLFKVMALSAMCAVLIGWL
jgi:hypothetical protein